MREPYTDDEHFRYVKISEKEYELYDKITYEVGEVVCISQSVLYWDNRLWVGKTNIKNPLEEQFVIFEKKQNTNKHYLNDVIFRTYLYSIVKIDDINMTFSHLPSDNLNKVKQ